MTHLALTEGRGPLGRRLLRRLAEAWRLKFHGDYEDANGNVRYRCARWAGG